MGQDTQVLVTTAVLDTGNEPNISSRTVDILTWSASQVEAITGVKSPVVNTDILDTGNISLEDYNDRYTVALEELNDTKNVILSKSNLNFLDW